MLLGLLVAAAGAVAWSRRGPNVAVGSFSPLPAPADASVLLGAGDIGDCGTLADDATARLVESIDGTVFAAGDTAYDRGTLDEFARCYTPTWGRFLARTLPAVGNHEYETPGAAGYFAYFGPLAGTAGEGWYAADVGSWRVYVLNSNCPHVACGRGSPQLDWLESELRERPAQCSLAIMHHPFVSSAARAESGGLADIWAAAVRGGVDVVVTGHDHLYERFAPLGEDGRPAADGTRLFIAGTGGGGDLHPFGAVEPGSEVRDRSTFGVIRFELAEAGYRWQFLPAAGGTFTDSGEGACR